MRHFVAWSWYALTLPVLRGARTIYSHITNPFSMPTTPSGSKKKKKAKAYTPASPVLLRQLEWSVLARGHPPSVTTAQEPPCLVPEWTTTSRSSRREATAAANSTLNQKSLSTQASVDPDPGPSRVTTLTLVSHRGRGQQSSWVSAADGKPRDAA